MDYFRHVYFVSKMAMLKRNEMIRCIGLFVRNEDNFQASQYDQMLPFLFPDRFPSALWKVRDVSFGFKIVEFYGERRTQLDANHRIILAWIELFSGFVACRISISVMHLCGRQFEFDILGFETVVRFCLSNDHPVKVMLIVFELEGL